MQNNDDFLATMLADTPPVEPAPPADPQDIDIVDSPPTDPEEAVVEPPEEGDAQLQAYVEFLTENELVELPENFEFKGTPAELETIFSYTKQRQVEKAAEALAASLPQEFKSVLDYALNGGQDIKSFLERYGVDPLMNVDLTTTDGQKEAVFLALKKTSNYSDERINKIVARLAEVPEDLAEEANLSYTELQELRKQEQEAELLSLKESDRIAREKAEAKTQALAAAIESSPSVHPQRRNKIKAFFFDPINTPSGVSTGFNQAINSILANPEHQAQLADLLLEYDPSAGFSLERLERKVKTKATQQFQEALSRTLDPKQAQRASTKPPQTNTDDSVLWNL